MLMPRKQSLYTQTEVKQYDKDSNCLNEKEETEVTMYG